MSENAVLYDLERDPFAEDGSELVAIGTRPLRRALKCIRDHIVSDVAAVSVRGPGGVGKTYLSLALPTVLDESMIAVRLTATVSDATLEAALRKTVGATGGATLREALAATRHKGKRIVCVVDGMERGPTDGLERWSKLFKDCEDPIGPLLQAVLIARDEASPLPVQQWLDQVAPTRVELEPLRGNEIESYLERRLHRVGYRGPTPFSGGAIDAIHRHSNGLPREINRLCSCVLERAATDRPDLIDELRIEDAVTALGSTAGGDARSVLGRVQLVRKAAPTPAAERAAIMASVSVAAIPGETVTGLAPPPLTPVFREELISIDAQDLEEATSATEPLAAAPIAPRAEARTAAPEPVAPEASIEAALESDEIIEPEEIIEYVEEIAAVEHAGVAASVVAEPETSAVAAVAAQTPAAAKLEARPAAPAAELPDFNDWSDLDESEKPKAPVRAPQARKVDPTPKPVVRVENNSPSEVAKPVRNPSTGPQREIVTRVTSTPTSVAAYKPVERSESVQAPRAEPARESAVPLRAAPVAQPEPEPAPQPKAAPSRVMLPPKLRLPAALVAAALAASGFMAIGLRSSDSAAVVNASSAQAASASEPAPSHSIAFSESAGSRSAIDDGASDPAALSEASEQGGTTASAAAAAASEPEPPSAQQERSAAELALSTASIERTAPSQDTAAPTATASGPNAAATSPQVTAARTDAAPAPTVVPSVPAEKPQDARAAMAALATSKRGAVAPGPELAKPSAPAPSSSKASASEAARTAARAATPAAPTVQIELRPRGVELLYPERPASAYDADVK